MTEKYLHDLKRKYGFSSSLEKSMRDEIKSTVVIELENCLYFKGSSSGKLVFNVETNVYGMIDQESGEFINIITGERYPILKTNSNYQVLSDNTKLLDLGKEFTIDYRINNVSWKSISDEQYSIFWKNYKQIKKEQQKSMQKVLR